MRERKTRNYGDYRSMILDATSSTIQSMPLTRPSPVRAEQDWISQWRLAYCAEPRLRCSEISSGESALGRSCLLAKMRRPAARARRSVARGRERAGRRRRARAAELLVDEERRELVAARVEAPLVRAVDDPDQPVGDLEVVAPVCADRLLAADVPEVEVEAAVLERLDVEAERRLDGVRGLVVELLHDRRLARVVEPDDQDLHLLLLLPQLAHDGEEAHRAAAPAKRPGRATRRGERRRGARARCSP